MTGPGSGPTLAGMADDATISGAEPETAEGPADAEPGGVPPPGGWQGPPPGGWHAGPGWQGPPPGWDRPPGPWDQGPGQWQGPAGGWYGGAPGHWQSGSPWPPPGPGPHPWYGWGPQAGPPPRRRVPRTPEERRRRRRLALVLSGVLVLAVGAGIGIGAWIAPTSPTAVASGLVGKAVSAATEAGSFHYVEISTANGHYSRFVGDAGANGGVQHIRTTGKSGTDAFTLYLVGGVVYFNGNVPAVVDQLYVPATKATAVAGHWVKVVRGEAPYKTLAEGITAKSNISQLTSTFAATSSAAVPGASPPSTRVEGSVRATGHVLPGQATLTMATATSLPERFTALAGTATAHLEMRWTFNHYREKVPVHTPKTSQPWSSLGAKPPPPSKH